MKATIAAFCGMLTLGSAIAQAETSTMAPDTAPKGGKMTYESGKKMDEKNMRKVTLTVKDVDQSNHRVTFEAQVAPEAQLNRDGVPIKLDQLRPGDEVRAAFDPTTGEVQKLEIQRSGEQNMQKNQKTQPMK